MKYFTELLAILNEMSPYLLFGFLISGILHVFVPRSLYQRFLAKKGFGSVFWAAILGVPLPLCSCGVLPTAVSLKKEGASNGATISFLISTPQTGVDSILATYSVLGPIFAIIRPIAAFIVAICGGVLVDKFGEDKKPSKKFSPIMSGSPTQVLSNSHASVLGSSLAPVVSAAPATSVISAAAQCSCGCSSSQSKSTNQVESHSSSTSKESKFTKLMNKIIEVFKYGYVDMMKGFGKWLVIGLIIAAAISLLPNSVFELFKDYPFLNILLILLLSAPMYICATGSIPIALSLMLKGVSPGAAFVLLMAGPATNAASLIIIKKEIGMRNTMIYLATIIIGAILCAFFIDYVIFPDGWLLSFGRDGNVSSNDSCCDAGPIWWQTTASVAFILLFINSYIQKWRVKSKGGSSHSCCGSK